MPSLFIGIQARLDSQRFPQKSLYPILGIPLIIRVIQRINQIQFPHQIALLVPHKDHSTFHTLLQKHQLDTPIFAGDADNVLARYYNASKHFHAKDMIMRVTGDNPLISVPLAEMLIEEHIKNKFDLSHYIGNPLGSGVEIISFSALEKSFYDATTPHHLEHVTAYLYKNHKSFNIGELESPFKNNSITHLSIDHFDDVKLIEKLLKKDQNWDISKQYT